ncbi:uncharacterized protein LOC118436617 [Folsomia candida]|nr:uncharacterized protein LOC118436617 [Folsomia candida]
MKVDPFENICHSMFPRIKLSPSDLVDNKVNTRIPKTLRLVTLHSLLLRKSRRHPSLESTKAGIQLRKSHLSRNKRPSDGVSGTDYEAKTLVFRRVKFCRGTPIHVSLNLDIHQKFMEDDFNTAYGEYICLRNRRDRLTWLTKLTEGRLRDKLEYDTMELFKPSWTAREARRTLSLKRPLGAPPNLLEHVAPQRNKQGCRPIGRSLVEEEDLQFVQNKLASAPRTSGYLEYVFGYRKPPPEDADLKNFEFKVDPKAAKEAGQVVKDVPTGCRKAFLYLGGWFFAFQLWLASMYELIFPSFERVTESQLPEISLTMPSPEHSTTDFHSFCTQKQVFDKETDLDKARRRASAYIQLSRRARKPEIDLEDFEEFLVPSEAFVGEMTKQRKERNSGEDKESKLGNNSPPKK